MLLADHDILFNLIAIHRHPRNKQTRVGARNEVMDVKPDTANTSCKVGVIGRLGGRKIVIVVLLIILFLVGCVPFAALCIVL